MSKRGSSLLVSRQSRSTKQDAVTTFDRIQDAYNAKLGERDKVLVLNVFASNTLHFISILQILNEI